MLHTAMLAMLYLFPVSEVALALRKRAVTGGAQSQDRGSLRMLWIVNSLAIGAAYALALKGFAPLRLPSGLRDGLVVLLMGSGLLLRWAAIRALGRFFTVDVAIHPEHKVVQSGPYAWVRHPSYSGLLLLFLGLGLRFGDALSLITLMLPVTLGLLSRIRTEEAALRSALGDAYESYCRRTKRLVPGVI
jgi:protein-S-isoprenylcysteine O-methyltransferase